MHLQSANIQTLLSLLIQHNQNVDRALFTATFTKHSLAIESLAMHVKSIETAFQQNPQMVESGVTGAFKSTSETNEAIVDGRGIEIHVGRDRGASHERVVSLHLDSASSDDTRKALPVQNLHGNPTTFGWIEKLKDPICTSSLHKGLPSAKPSILSSEGPRLESQIILSQKLLVETSLAIVGYLVSEGNTVLQKVARLLLEFLKMFLLSLPRVLVLLRLLWQVPRAAPLILDDNIRFEDFRYWTVFEASLRCTFNNTPGMQKVLQRQFVLKYKGACEEVLDATNWEEKASPGMTVTMSISISTILTPSGHCPMGCVAPKITVSDSEACCTQCDLTFSIRRPPHREVLRTLKFLGARPTPLAPRAIRVRKVHKTDATKPDTQEKRKRRESAESRFRAQLKIDKTELPNLLRFESSFKEKEEHQLEVQELTHFKRVHLIEDTVLKWTWAFYCASKPWNWVWYVELPEVRAEWKTAEFWESISGGLGKQPRIQQPDFSQHVILKRGRRRSCVGFSATEQIPESDSESDSEPYRHAFAKYVAKIRAAQFSRDTPLTSPPFKRTYTIIYTGSLSVSKSDLCITKIPFIHLLATKPLTPSQIRSHFCMPKLECDQLLAIFARDFPSDPDKKELQEISYKELDVWGFPYHMQSLRQAAIDRSIEAFDILQIDQKDNLWQALLPSEQRGRRICLSRRNLG